MSIKINKIMTILTVFTAIIWIHTLIAGLYWMNVSLPWGTNPYAFWFIILFNAFITILLLWFFKMKRRL
jgi:Mg2+ and Co2+ transporter CorA